jgi:hypothetical protein
MLWIFLKLIRTGRLHVREGLTRRSRMPRRRGALTTMTAYTAENTAIMLGNVLARDKLDSTLNPPK